MANTKKDETVKVETEKDETVKVETKREDPIARAQRLLQETIEKTREKAEKELVKAREELEASQRNVDKAVRVRDERAARVERLAAHAQGNPAFSYAAALGAEVPTDELDLG